MWSVNSVAKPLRKRGLASTHTVYAFIHETRAVLARLSPGAGSRGNGNSSVCVAPNFALAHGPLFLLRCVLQEIDLDGCVRSSSRARLQVRAMTQNYTNCFPRRFEER